jgi:hypothetical protein
VEILWTAGAYPVEEATRKFFFRDLAMKMRRSGLCIRFRAALRLIAARRSIQFIRFPKKIQRFASTPVTSAVHRFEQSIAGRPYLIEVVAVSKDRWRAYIVRLPGVPTALMPFYGSTPIEAADHLCGWLTRAHARASSAAGTV